MVNSAMDVEDQNEQSSDILKEQFIPGDDYALKVRKPYTITKQRERWTEEEHTKFIEALKLYGRAWRRIEEHVGTKTTVQIRSHAQKFFSKVVRESNGGDASSIKPIEIPPPRPKRKPMHPYPRKITSPVVISESERETCSPTSVLSPVGSDTLATPDSNSNTINGGSHSPISEENRSSSNLNDDEEEQVEEEVIVQKLELFPQDVGSVKEEGSAQYLKLFGKTVLVNDYHRQSTLALAPPERGFSSPLPWWTSSGGAPESSIPVPTTKSCSDTQKEVSRTDSNGSNTDSDVEDQSLGFSLERRSTKIACTEHREKGFRPYKRCLAQRDNHSYGGSLLTLGNEERIEQRVRLCL